MSKHKVGDSVWVHGRAAKVLEIYEEHYFYSGTDPYYTYDITYLDEPGSKYRMMESILDTGPKKALLCECGAWAVHWATNEHSRWCPAHKTF